MNAAIQLTGLTKRFGERVALNAISATIPTGGITGLVGPDGAGKSTLLRLLAGLLVPEAGEIRVLGLDPVREGDALRQRLGYMPQQFGLYEDLSVQENLSLYADLRGVLEPERTPHPGATARLHRSRPLHRAASGQAVWRDEAEDWGWPAPCSAPRTCCCSTSPGSGSIPSPAAPSGRWCASWPREA